MTPEANIFFKLHAAYQEIERLRQQKEWIDAKSTPPQEIGLYWCLVEGKSATGHIIRYQGVFYYNPHASRWNGVKANHKIISYTSLMPETV